MAKLLVFAPVERAIVAQESNNLSLISILSEIKIAVRGGAQPPQGAKAPFSWATVVVWNLGEASPGELLEQRVELVAPDGAVVLFDESKVPVAAANTRTIIRFPEIPVGEGTYNLRLLKRTSGEWFEVAAYPISIRHTLNETPSTE